MIAKREARKQAKPKGPAQLKPFARAGLSISEDEEMASVGKRMDIRSFEQHTVLEEESKEEDDPHEKKLKRKRTNFEEDY